MGDFFLVGGSKFLASGGFFPHPSSRENPLTYVTLPKYSPITDAFLKMVKNEVSGLLSLSVLDFLRIAS